MARSIRIRLVRWILASTVSFAACDFSDDAAGTRSDSGVGACEPLDDMGCADPLEDVYVMPDNNDACRNYVGPDCEDTFTVRRRLPLEYADLVGASVETCNAELCFRGRLPASGGTVPLAAASGNEAGEVAAWLMFVEHGPMDLEVVLGWGFGSYGLRRSSPYTLAMTAQDGTEIDRYEAEVASVSVSTFGCGNADGACASATGSIKGLSPDGGMDDAGGDDTSGEDAGP